MTRYRESELCSSSIYNQNDPWDPPVVFEEFLRNNEDIEDEVPAPPSSSPSPVPGSVPSGSLLCGEQAQWSLDLFIPLKWGLRRLLTPLLPERFNTAHPSLS